MSAKFLKDALKKLTRALPGAASTTVTTATALDTMNGTRGQFVTDVEFKLTAPAVTTTMAPDTRTFTYNIIHSVNSDLSSPATLISAAIVQTGASGAGAATASYTFKLPSTVRRYVGFTVVSGASTADASSVTATLEELF